ncbi:MAG: putative efflux ABC-transporter, permease protein [Pseudomonadota bacterium]|jgi:lipopolysaccharide transport system permease protein
MSVIRDLRDSVLVPFNACVKHASLLRMLIRRDLVARTSGTLLGKLWPLLQPALQVLGFWFLFDVVWGARAGRGDDFLPYLLIGILPWLLLSEVLTRASGLFREFANLYRRTPFPVELLPVLVMVIPGLVYLVVLCGVAFAFYGPLAALQSLLIVPLLLLWLLPLALLFSVLGLFIRDFAQALPFVLTLVMYSIPVLYSPEMLPEGVQQWLWLNPFADLVAVIHATVDDTAVEWHRLARLAAVWLLLLAPCWAVFRRSVPHVREVL